MANNTYNPTLGTLLQKPLGVSKAQPADQRSYYYDSDHFVYRPFVSVAEVLAYFPDPTNRKGHASIFINTGGTIDPNTGILSGGTNKEYWFKDTYNDAGLVPKSTDISQAQIDTWNAGGTANLDTVLAGNNDSNRSMRVGAISIKAASTLNMTTLESASTDPNRVITFADVSGTPLMSINNNTADPNTGDLGLNFYTQDQVYTKAEVDALLGTGTPGSSGVSSFKSRTGAVTPATGDYTPAMVGLDKVDNTSDATKNSAAATLSNKTLTSPKITTILNGTATLTLPTTTGTLALASQITGVNSGVNTGDQDLSGYVTKVTGKSLIADSEIARLANVQNTVITQGANITISGAGTSGSPYVINSTATASASITAGPGVNSVTIPAGRLVREIILLATSDTVSAGSTSTGKDYLDSIAVTGQSVEYVGVYFPTSATFYFTKGANTTAIIY